MKIKGIQKVTLIDYPGKIASTLFLFGCNFCCGFCHNPELVLNEKENKENIPKEEVLDYLKKREDYLTGVCITGGEPLISLEKEFLRDIKKIGYEIKLDTNGSFPNKLREFIEEGLIDSVAMDVKNKKEKYEEITNCKVDLEKIEESMKIISLLKDYEFRTTVVEGLHSIEDLKEIALWLNKITAKKPKKFVLQGFKNMGKIIDNKMLEFYDCSEEFLLKIKEEVKDYFEQVEIRV
jgi:anaerobic ribonucleoside-triphosphate reductase activating protein